jgi:hypothetical protein
VLWGTLCATVLVHPSVRRDPALTPAVRRLVHGLGYGTVTVNVAAFAAYYLQVAPWGAAPDPRTGGDTDSGVGRTANPWRLGGVRRSVVGAPCAGDPALLLATARRPDLAARAVARWEAGR